MRNVHEDALLLQDASNVSGVIHALSEIVTNIQNERYEKGPGLDQASLRAHPAVVLVVNKLEEMVGSNYGDRYHEAYTACKLEVAKLEAAKSVTA